MTSNLTYSNNGVRKVLPILLSALLWSAFLQGKTIINDHVPENLRTRHSTVFGIGTANTYDNYLSPLEYDGWGGTFMHETWRMTHWAHISTQGVWKGHASSTKNPSKNRNEWGGLIGYEHLWHYNWFINKHWTLRAGGGIGGNIGGLYNTHAGNNPAQGYVDIGLIASVAADYTFMLWQHPFTVRGQMDAPFLGMMFSPRYGQSYYNIFLQGNYDKNIVCMTPINAPTLRGWLTIDFPLGSYTLRAGYSFDVIQAQPNNLRRHTYLNNFVIGWVKHFVIEKRKKGTKL